MRAQALRATLGADRVLRIEGTPYGELINVRQDAGQVSVSGIQISTPSGLVSSLAAGDIGRIEVLGLGGSDVTRLDQGTEALLIDALLVGGTGSDRLRGGAGTNIFVVGSTEVDRCWNADLNDRAVVADSSLSVKTVIRPTDGWVFAVRLDGSVFSEGVVTWSGVRDIAVSQNGTFYVLGTNGTLERNVPSIGLFRLT